MANKTQVSTVGEQQAAIVINNQFVDGLTKQLEEKCKYGLSFPKDYNLSNALMGAYLVLKETKDRNNKPILESCSQISIANSLMNMATLGLSVQKKQGYFIAYSGQCQFQRSYFGNMTIARRYWICQCDCGNTKTVEAYALKIGRTKSCGCLSVDIARQKAIRHGLRHTRIYNIWRNMKYRCEHKDHPQYIDYGGRGIYVCEEWHDFMMFYKWATENGYQDNLTIDRIDNNNGYSPDNCRWVDAKIQGNNKRNNLIVEFKGKPMTISQISDLTGINYEKLRKAFHSGRIYKMLNEEPEDSEVIV